MTERGAKVPGFPENEVVESEDGSTHLVVHVTGRGREREITPLKVETSSGTPVVNLKGPRVEVDGFRLSRSQSLRRAIVIARRPGGVVNWPKYQTQEGKLRDRVIGSVDGTNHLTAMIYVALGDAKVLARAERKGFPIEVDPKKEKILIRYSEGKTRVLRTPTPCSPRKDAWSLLARRARARRSSETSSQD